MKAEKRFMIVLVVTMLLLSTFTSYATALGVNDDEIPSCDKCYMPIRICNCNKEENEHTDPTEPDGGGCEHEWGKPVEKNSSTHTKTCNRCHQIVSEDHRYSENIEGCGSGSYHLCKCGARKSAKCPHREPHKLYISTSSAHHTVKCGCCNETLVHNEPHSWTYPQNSLGRKCNECGYSEPNYCRHNLIKTDFGNDNSHRATCTICKKEFYEPHNFEYVGNSCIDCGYKMAIPPDEL